MICRFRTPFHKGLHVFQNRAGQPGLQDRPEYRRAAISGMSPDELTALRQGVRVAAGAAATRQAGGNGAKPNGHAAAVEDWPEPLGEPAYHGLAGDVVRRFAPHTEADPVAILLQFLCAFGCAAGRGSYLVVEGDRHPPQIWPVLVGKSAKARKGASWGRIRCLFEEAAPD
jgi:hypothetical protein